MSWIRRVTRSNMTLLSKCRLPFFHTTVEPSNLPCLDMSQLRLTEPARTAPPFVTTKLQLSLLRVHQVLARQSEGLFRTTRPEQRLASSLHDSSPDSKTNKANFPHRIPITKHHHRQLLLVFLRTLASRRRHWNELNQGRAGVPQVRTRMSTC